MEYEYKTVIDFWFNEFQAYLQYAYDEGWEPHGPVHSFIHETDKDETSMAYACHLRRIKKKEEK